MVILLKADLNINDEINTIFIEPQDANEMLEAKEPL